MDSKLGPSLVLLCALLSTACPGDDGGDTGADTGATGTTAASTSTASPTDTDSGSAETGTETETIPPDTETDADTETDTGMPIEGCECIEDQPVPEIANTPEVRSYVESLHAVKRIAEPEEIAASVLHLASDASRFITGTAMLVDGGCSISRP